jgi:hypothetical protein
MAHRQALEVTTQLDGREDPCARPCSGRAPSHACLAASRPENEALIFCGEGGGAGVRHTALFSALDWRVAMADKKAPRRTADPWDASVRKQEQQGQLRDSNAAAKLKGEKDARRRDDQALRRGQNDGGKGRAGPTGKTQRGNR